MNWKKIGLIYKPQKIHHWSISHAQIPSGIIINDETLRIYFGTRDKLKRTVTTFIDVKPSFPKKIRKICGTPVLNLGDIGCFDDCGAMPSWLINKEEIIYLFYTGWNVSNTVPYRNSIGLAVSKDNGVSFQKLFSGPILDRNYIEPYFCATPCVMLENGIWRMWYLSCTKWEIFNGRKEPQYNIKYAESKDGIEWKRKGITCIDFKSPKEGAIARPSVLKENNSYKMWYSMRGIKNYRKNSNNSYRIGYAESSDGIKWERKDKTAGINVSKSGWDSEMITYPFVYKYKNQKYLLYNGNGFGKSGFGCAVLKR
jgi:hypothetical protein